MAFQGHGQFFDGDAAAIVFDRDQANATAQQAQRDVARTRIEGVVDQFTHHGGRALNDFTRRNLADQHIGEFTNGSSGLGLAHPQIVGVPAPGLAPILKGQKTGIIGPWTP